MDVAWPLVMQAVPPATVEFLCHLDSWVSAQVYESLTLAILIGFDDLTGKYPVCSADSDRVWGGPGNAVVRVNLEAQSVFFGVHSVPGTGNIRHS